MTATTSIAWSTVPISDLYQGLYDGPHATPKPADDGPVFLGIKNVTEDGHLDLSDVRHIAEEDFGQWTRRVEPRAGDLVFTYEATLNRYAIIPHGFRGCLGRRMALVRPDPRKVNTRYLHFYFFTPEWRAVVRRHTLAGATVDRLPLTRFPGFPVRVPSLPDQERIAGILSAYDDLIKNCERRVCVLDDMARSLYREWFVLFRYPGHEKVPHVESSLGPIPKGWRAGNLSGFVENGSVSLQTGPFGTQLKASDYSSEGTPVINVRNIGLGSVRRDKLEYLAPGKAEEHRRHQLRPGDIVFGRKGAVDRHLLVSSREEGWIQGSDCIRMRLESDQLSPRLLSLRFREEGHRAWMLTHCSGAATMASLNQDIIGRIPVLLPPGDLLARFDGFVGAAFDSTTQLSSEIENLRRTRDLLLPRLLSGQLSVDDVA